MRSRARTVIIWSLVVVAIILVVGYSLFEARRFLEGPTLTVDMPENGATVSSALVEIAGTAKNIVDIRLNDRKIFVDSDGHFSEDLLLSYGYTILTLKAHDRFGHETSKTLELVYQ